MSKTLKVDLHNHTVLCNHAEADLHLYIEAAIKAGIDKYGVSDHAPMDFDPKYRMRFEQMDEYKTMVTNVQEKYKDQIDVLFAYEVDYLPGHMDKRVLEADVDYLIGSAHFINKWGFDNPEFIGKYEGADIDTIWKEYFDLIKDMAETGYFDIVGHLDLIKVFKYMPKGSIVDIAEEALVAIKKADMVLELNVAGYRKPCAEPYPSKSLLQRAFELDIPITFSSDAHKPEQVGLFRDEIEAFAKEVGYTQCAYFKKRQRFMVNF
ncbi:MAG: histidinol phosphate phosphatase [Arcobacter sp.]|nr:MAG: histidinol phosphate phosphatase [Arcobacter sp.]